MKILCMAELNTKSDYCMECGYDGQIEIIEEEKFRKINMAMFLIVGNKDQSKMSVARRTCGYIGTQFWEPKEEHKKSKKEFFIYKKD
ncbi:anaerobic ribonucleoside-triphosphate reductase [Lachnobacterium bovis]|uniref:anaerobic ribonucleoside-triphosphate reductase n=1 Tax=Lachnobacterium bovis TaxID=140626 RepID=UPI00048BD328|nr:anaerobic ribonucleoside-triphosphate reductase [Lachnobacterium bovis]